MSTARRVPALPDLRFEYSYLKSISSVFRQPSIPQSSRDGNLHERRFVAAEAALVGSTDVQPGAEVAITQSLCGVPMSIDWGQLVWITTRDQVNRYFQACGMRLWLNLCRS